MSTAARLSRCRRKPPATAPRTMDLLGMAEDGTLYLWQENAQVQPLSAFPMNGKLIVSGHYVIESRGAAVAVHCANSINPSQIVLQYMCRGARSVVVERTWLAPSLLGQVLKDPKEEAEILAMLRQMTADAVARQQAPHRRRGHA